MPDTTPAAMRLAEAAYAGSLPDDMKHPSTWTSADRVEVLIIARALDDAGVRLAVTKLQALVRVADGEINAGFRNSWPMGIRLVREALAALNGDK